MLTAEEMLDSDVAAARDDRRVAEGFISPADARAFLALARRGGDSDVRDPITRAYFRALAPTEPPQQKPKSNQETEAAPRTDRPKNRGAALATDADVLDLAALLREAEVIAPEPTRPLAGLLGASDETSPAKQHLVAPLFEQAMTDLRHRDPALFSTRAREIGYLVNVWLAGGTHEGRRPRPVEALELVLRTCEAGMRTQLPARSVTPEQGLAVLMRTPADALFRRGRRAQLAVSPP